MNRLGKASLFLWLSDLFQTGIQVLDKLFLVKVLADEDNLLHAVAIVFVPVSQQAGVALHQFHDFFFRLGSIPESGF